MRRQQSVPQLTQSLQGCLLQIASQSIILIQGGLTGREAGGHRGQPGLRGGVEGEAFGADEGSSAAAGGGCRALVRVGRRAGEGGTLPKGKEATTDL